jgi:legumain
MRVSLILVAILGVALADNWAVIVAGSNGWYNYRHHADVCHSYHIVSGNGIPDSNIIVMLYDDVANAQQNPVPGKLFNKPTEAGTPGVDVYEGCQKDYTGQDVTPANFLKIITGDAKGMEGIGSGKVLKSGPNDKVFINFADHGATGLIAFPAGGYLYADKLMQGLQTMHDNTMYKELVFYMEACESGSMFNNILPTNLNIFATTAADTSESSWGTYCPPDDKVNGVSIGSCLGDLYSVNWMEDSDSTQTETLEAQYKKVVKETVKSHPMQFGTMTFNTEPIGDFQSEEKSLRRNKASTPDMRKTSVDSRDNKMHMLYHKYLTTGENFSELHAELRHRDQSDSTFKKIAVRATGAELGAKLYEDKAIEVSNFDCLRQAVDTYEKYCEQLSDYSLKYVRVLKNLCETTPESRVVAAVIDTCMA